MKLQALKGFLLEEVVAHMMGSAGYRHVTDAAQDVQMLAAKGNGLNLAGRGGEHQIDVLGELVWTPMFTAPLRLLIEAKFHKGPVGLPVLREQAGILADVNQEYHRMLSLKQPRAIYRYTGAVASASGFAATVEDFALAHHISLIDLSGEAYSGMLDRIENVAEMIRGALPQKVPINAIRQTYRGMAGMVGGSVHDLDNAVVTGLASLSNQISQDTKTFLAMTAGGLALLARETGQDSDFVRYARGLPFHNVDIHWTRESMENGQTWWISPSDNPAAYRIEFRLPRRLAKHVMVAGRPVKRHALNVKASLLNTMTVYFEFQGTPHMAILTYDAETALTNPYDGDN